MDAGTFLVAAVAVSALRIPSAPAHPAPRAGWRRDLTAAAGQLRRTPELRRAVALAAGAMALSGVVVAAQYDLVGALHRAPSFLGTLTALLGAGSIVAGLTSGRLITRLGEANVLLLGLVNGAAGYALRATGQLVPALVGSFVLGFALPWVVVAAVTMSQRLTPPGLQGRTAAAVTLALFAPLPVTQAVGAALITIVDYRVLYAIAAGIQLAVAGLVHTAGRPRPSRPV